MPSLLAEYPNCASNREEKFKRAVVSFLEQDCPAELVIVADGCEKTSEVFSDVMSNYKLNHVLKTEGEENISSFGLFNKKQIALIDIKKQSTFSGSLRNKGIEHALGEIICYLDTDDMLLPGHLSFIRKGFANNPEIDFAIFNDFVATTPDLKNKRMRGAHYFPNCIGSSNIAHRSTMYARWEDGYGHDFVFAEKLFNESAKNKHIGIGNYLTCHIPKQVDF